MRIGKRMTGLAAAMVCGLLAAPVAHAGDSALADAAMNRDMETVRKLLAEKADPNTTGKYDMPALSWVVRVQDLDTAKRLIRAGADVNLAAPYGVMPLHLAVQNGDVRMVDLLLDAGADANSADRTGETVLMMAAQVGNPDIVKALVKAGAKVDARDPAYLQTPLMVAARGGHAEVARFLISRGADVNAQSAMGEVPEFKRPEDSKGSKGVGIIRSGWPAWGERNPVPGAKTPLLYAARNGHPDVAAILVEAGADIEKADGNGDTPLLTAILTQHAEVAEYLLGQGAFVNAQDWYGQTPLWAAVDMRNLDVSGATRDNGVDREAWLKIIRTLLDKGADPNVRTLEYPPQRRFVTRLGSLAWVDFTGQTPFLRAAYSGDITVMRLLVEYGANPNIPTYAGTTPLMAAAGMNWTVNQTFDEGPEHILAAVKYAHELGNDVNARNNMGLQAIHAAANRGANNVIQYLVEQGAELDVPDNVGRTPMDWAEGVFLATHPPERKPETIALLEKLKSGF